MATSTLTQLLNYDSLPLCSLILMASVFPLVVVVPVGRGVGGGREGGSVLEANSKHWFTSFLQPLSAVVNYAIGSRKLSACPVAEAEALDAVRVVTELY